MPYITLKLQNGKEWLVTHCEVVLTPSSLQGMSSEEIGRKVLELTATVNEFAEYLWKGGLQGHFDSLEEFAEAVAEQKRMEEEQRLRQEKIKRVRQEIRSDYERTFVRLGRRDGFKCRVCGEATNVLQIDHIMPVSKDGDNDLSNLQLLCFDCNNKKSNR